MTDDTMIDDWLMTTTNDDVSNDDIPRVDLTQLGVISRTANLTPVPNPKYSAFAANTRRPTFNSLDADSIYEASTFVGQTSPLILGPRVDSTQLEGVRSVLDRHECL